jgi:hypothetical protein
MESKALEAENKRLREDCKGLRAVYRDQCYDFQTMKAERDRLRDLLSLVVQFDDTECSGEEYSEEWNALVLRIREELSNE